MKISILKYLPLNFEGGHPDHDQVAILVNKLKNIYKFKAFFFSLLITQEIHYLFLTVYYDLLKAKRILLSF